MNRSVWLILLGIFSFLVIIFILFFFGALLDIKYCVESQKYISNGVIETCYKNVYIFSSLIIIQFILIIYFLTKFKPKL